MAGDPGHAAQHGFGVLSGQGGKIKGRGADGDKSLAPHDSHQGRRHQAHGEKAGIARPDLAPGLGPFNDLTEQGQDGIHRALMPDGGQLREVAGLGQDHLHNAAQGRMGGQGTGHSGELQNPVGKGDGGLRQLPHEPDVRRHCGFHHGAEDVLFGGEVEIDGALGDARPGGDVIQPGRGESPFDKHLQRRRNDLVGAFGLAAAELGRAWGQHDGA